VRHFPDFQALWKQRPSIRHPAAVTDRGALLSTVDQHAVIDDFDAPLYARRGPFMTLAS